MPRSPGCITRPRESAPAGSSVDVAKATVARAEAAVAAADAQLKLATNNYHRIEPLLKKQYVTVEQIDQANTTMSVAQNNYDEAEASLNQAKAQQAQASLREVEASSAASESQAKLGQALHTIDNRRYAGVGAAGQGREGRERAARPRTLPRGLAVRRLRHQHEHLRRCLRASGDRSVHAHRHADLVRCGKLSRGPN